MNNIKTSRYVMKYTKLTAEHNNSHFQVYWPTELFYRAISHTHIFLSLIHIEFSLIILHIGSIKKSIKTRLNVNAIYKDEQYVYK